MLIPTRETLPDVALLPIQDWLALSEHYRDKKDLVSTRRLHTQLHGNGLLSFGVLGNSLVRTFAESESIRDAFMVFFKLEDRNQQSWTSLIEATAKYGDCEDAFELLQSMQDDGVAPRTYTYLSLVSICAKLKYEDRGRGLHTQIICAGLEADEFLGNAIVDMYAKFGCLADAQSAFDQLPVQTVVSWNSLISGYVDHGLGERALHLFEQMQEKAIHPSAITFIACLKACGNLRDYENCQGIHAEVVKEGFDSDHFVGSTLLCVYAKCGFVVEAQELFDDLTVHDVVSWTALIAGYADHGCGDQALHLFDRMQVEGIAPSVITYACGFQSCGSIDAWQRGYELHCEIIKEGLSMDFIVEGCIVDMYAKCGLLEEAEDVLNESPARDVVHFTALIAGFAQGGFHEEARKLLKQMQAERITPDAVTLVGILKACVNSVNLCLGQDIHAEVAKEGAETDLFVVNTLVDMYAKCGALLEAREVFNEQGIHDVVTWSTLIAAFTEHDLDEEALNCFADMQQEGILPDTYVFASILKACANLGSLDMGQKIYAKIVEEELERDGFIGNILVTMYGKCGSWEEAFHVFDSLQFRDLVSWNALIEFTSSNDVLDCLDRMRFQCVTPDAQTFVCCLKACNNDIDTGLKIHAEVVKGGFEAEIMICNSSMDMYFKCGMLFEAKDLFDSISSRDVVSWNTLIAGFVDQGLNENALQSLDQMQAETILLDVASCISGLNACGNLQAIDKGQELHVEIAKERFDSNSGIGHALIEMYSECGWLAEAQEEFDSLLSVKDIFLWDSLIKGYSEQEDMEMAHLLYKQMQEQGLLPTSVIFRSLLNVYGSVVALDYVTKLDAQLCKHDGLVSWDDSLVTSTINSYLKCGSTLDAQFFPVIRNLCGWNTLMTGHVRQGKANEAFLALKQMEDKRFQPDEITFICLLNACCHGGFVEMGQSYYESMSKKYGITPSVKHDTCIMDLLGRSGRLNEAARMLEMLPCDNEDLVPWSSFLGACKNWGNVELGQHSIEQTMVLSENRYVPLMLMGDICSSNWGDQERGTR